VHLEHPEPERAPRLAGEHRHDLVAPALEDVRRLEEDALADGRRRLRPLREGSGRGLDGAPRILPPTGGDLGDDVARVRVAILERRAALRIGERAPPSGSTNAPPTKSLVSMPVAVCVLIALLSSAAVRAGQAGAPSAPTHGYGERLALL
jgi:hypothetical protein